MNKYLLKQSSILSLILGAILGLITLIPYLGILSFLICAFCSGTIILLYMQKRELLDKLEIKEFTIYGALCGFLNFIGFSLTFIPLAVIIGLLKKTSYYLGVAVLFETGIFMPVLIIIFLAITAALMSGFGSMVTAYTMNFINSQNKK